MYKPFGNITCDHCGAVLNEVDYISVKGKKTVLHYCNKKCKKKHKDE